MGSKIFRKLVEFVNGEDGPTAVEYGVMMALIIVVCFVSVVSLGKNTSKTFNTVAQSIGSGS